MSQPFKRNAIKPKQKKKTELHNRKAPSKHDTDEKVSKVRVWQQKPKRKHQEYGTSKLETKFAKNFLEPLGIKYVYQYKMESIGRYLDYYLPEENIAIEVDGDYYHSYGLMYEDMSPMQKKNARVDKQKTHWCYVNGIKLIRIWEHEINKSPEKVKKMLIEECSEAKEKQNKLKLKNTRH